MALESYCEPRAISYFCLFLFAKGLLLLRKAS